MCRLSMDLPVDDVPIGLGLKKKKKSKPESTQKSVFLKEAKQFKKDAGIRVRRIGSESTRIPPPIVNFNRLPSLYERFSPCLLQNLAAMSFNLPTPVQAQCIPVILNRSHVIACAPTGSGKTAAYLLPILQSFYEHASGVAEVSSATEESLNTHKIQLFGLILAPTQELVRQIWSEAVRLSHGLVTEHFLACLNRHHYSLRGKVSGNHPPASKRRRIRESRLPRKTRILVATPYRMAQLLSLDQTECPFDLSRLCWLVIDECDKLLEVDLTDSKSSVTDEEHSRRRLRCFRDQINPIFVSLRRWQTDCLPTQSVRVALFSATVPEEVVDWLSTELPELLPESSLCASEGDGKRAINLVQVRVGARDSAVSSVKQELRYCGTEEGKLLEIRFMLVRGLTYPCLIFMDSRERAKDIIKEILLSDADLLADVISSDKTEAQRAGVIRAFREGKLNVLVCTDLLGRGIDFKGVNMVVNYDMPSSKEDYIHRVGRTGRAGRQGYAVTFWTDADLPHMAEILKVIRRSGSPVDADLERLVNSWESRRTATILGTKKAASRAIILSKRRGERRLVQELVATEKRKLKNSRQADDPESKKHQKRIQWLRRWNPHRKRIRDLAGSRQNRVASEL